MVPVLDQVEHLDGAIPRATYLAAKGEPRRAWDCYAPSPVDDPSSREAKQATLDLLPQLDNPPTAAFADEPGVAPYTISSATFDRVIPHLPEIRAPGTLPQSNAIITACAEFGASAAMRAVFNTCLADDVHPFLASCLQDPRGAVIQKLDPISGAIVIAGRSAEPGTAANPRAYETRGPQEEREEKEGRTPCDRTHET
jgi:hypothetical protein